MSAEVPDSAAAAGATTDAVDAASTDEGSEDLSYDASTRRDVQKLPMLTVRAGPRDGAAWRERLKEEYKALIQYIKMNKENDNDWFTLASDESGVRYEAV
jgi:uncharacterized protein (DUF58 family)